ncbi:hypothetical protein GBAR_LOCUS10558, partial [Geodia barretti]
TTDHYRTTTDHYRTTTDHYRTTTDHYRTTTDHCVMKQRTQQNKTHPLEPKPDHSRPLKPTHRPPENKIGPQEPKADHWRNKCTPRQNPSRPQLNQKQINVTHNVVQGGWKPL